MTDVAAPHPVEGLVSDGAASFPVQWLSARIRRGLMYRYPYSRSPFSRFAKWTAHATGHPIAFVLAAATIAVWLITGPLFGFSDTWQLVINTGTTIVTFLMVFLIQNTQNRDSAAVHLKLDELIRTVAGAHNALLDLEELTEKDLERLRLRYESLGRAARAELLRGILDTNIPDVPDQAAPPTP
jgi:low affinity Fe/Cu permease